MLPISHGHPDAFLEGVTDRILLALRPPERVYRLSSCRRHILEARVETGIFQEGAYTSQAKCQTRDFYFSLLPVQQEALFVV